MLQAVFAERRLQLRPLQRCYFADISASLYLVVLIGVRGVHEFKYIDYGSRREAPNEMDRKVVDYVE